MRLGLFFAAGVLAASAQTEWRPIGSPAVETGLAGPITGRVNSVWFAPDGATLYARTDSGKTFETQDFENWSLAAADAPLAPVWSPRVAVRKPEPNALTFALNASSPVTWALGQQVYRSDDGNSWKSLTSYRSQSILGGGFTSVALSPVDSGQVVVANQQGVWRSMDSGLTWSGLNSNLPNLPVEKILATPSGGHAAQVKSRLGMLLLPPGGHVWLPVPGVSPDISKKYEYSQRVTGDVTAYAESADHRQVYVGTEDGRIWRSDDGGRTFPPSQAATATGHRVESLYVDPAQPEVVLAALSGEGNHVLRTWNSGAFWDPLDSSLLANVPAFGITADPASGAIYVATEKGVYWTQFDFEHGANTNNLTWKSLSDSLPQTKAVDVMLDPAGVQLYVALDGYGVFGTPAPHRTTGLRLVNTADQSTRAAAPGSLVTVVGQTVNSVANGTQRFPLWNNSFQVPFEAVGPMVSLALQTASGTATRDLAVQPVSPAIFVLDGVASIYDGDSGLPLQGAVAHPGQRLQIMVTGLGKVRPDWPTGMPAPAENPPAVVAKIQAYLDGNQVQVTRATLASNYVGMYVVEVQLPLVTNYGGMELHVTADGQESNHVQIAVVQ